MVFHKLFRRHHMGPGLATLAMLQPDLAKSMKKVTKPLATDIVRQWELYNH